MFHLTSQPPALLVLSPYSYNYGAWLWHASTHINARVKVMLAAILLWMMCHDWHRALMGTDQESYSVRIEMNFERVRTDEFGVFNVDSRLLL